MTRAHARGLILAVTLMLVMAGCAALGIQAGPPMEAASVQGLEYYTYQVKGYQGTYPHRTVLVLMPVDDRDFSDAGTPDHAPRDGKPAIGITLGQDGKIIQRLYSDPLSDTVQKAIARSADEAGMAGQLGRDSAYSAGKPVGADYVLTSRITRGWVIKRRGPDGRYGPVWATSANFALDVVIYKPPFSVPFWQGSSSSTYNDPPVGTFGLGPEDQAGIYDEPGQVLSVALTRSVAGIFQRPDLRALVMQDDIRPR